MQFARALVTGASMGIGAAIAAELARRGTDLVLVARSEDKLSSLAEQLADEHGVVAEVFPADLTDRDQLAQVEDRLRTEQDPIDLLVNNAGIGLSGPFLSSTPDASEKVITLNTIALTRLTQAVLPRLVEAGGGGVLNVSSVGSFQPVPHLGVYAATKAYVTSFTEAIHEELRGTGVHVTALCPGFTRTPFIVASGGQEEASNIPGFLWQEAEPVAVVGVDAVSKGRAKVVSGSVNQATVVASSLTPSSVSRRVISEVIDRFAT